MHPAPDLKVPRRGPGRPREFDIEAALDAALLVFRQRGYHATSLADLCEAMKLTPGSIYKAFSDKRAIFLAAFERYTTQRNAKLQAVLEAAPTGLGKLRVLLHFYAEASQGVEGQRGCLVAGSAAEIATFDPDMAAQVAAALKRVERLARDLIRQGQADGSVSTAIDPDAMACLLLSLCQGFRLIGKTGRARAEVMAAADQALRLFT